MEPERWSEVERLYHAALEREPDQRAGYLQAACGADQALRQEVEGLLAYQGQVHSFLEVPAPEMVAQEQSEERSRGFRLSAGDKIGPYEILAKIGAGGMGEVYRAKDTKLGRQVAIKILPDHLAADASARERLRREAVAAAALDHPFICKVFEIGEDRGALFLVMEFVTGDTLHQRLRSGNLPLPDALRISGEVAEALEEAHNNRMVHRDLKPANVMLTVGGHAKVMDFGLAKPFAATRLAQAAATATMPGPVLTDLGTAVGTPDYMSPEQVRGEALDQRSDVFSFGILLCELLGSPHPFRGASTTETLAAILRDPPNLSGDLPQGLMVLIRRLLEKSPDERYQSMAEVRADLQRLKGDSESNRSLAVAPPARRLPWIAGATLIGMAAAGAVYIFHRPAPKLTEKDTIVLADFTNTTGDSVFDGTLRQGLSAQLEQSPFLNQLSDQRIGETLALMGQPKDARLTQELGLGVCQRTASAATLEGSIASLGSQYVLGLKAVNCRSGDLLAQEQVTANGKEQVLKALGDAATKLRGKLGESLASVQKYDVPPENVTTPSLEALQAYSFGHQAFEKQDYAVAIPFFRRAVSLDPNFAMAYARLGQSYSNRLEEERAAESTRKAYELRGRTSEHEKFYISSHYEKRVTGDLEAARTTYQLWVQTYPSGEDTPWVNLASIYFDLGEYEKALTTAREGLKVYPGSALVYDRLVTAYLYLNRLDEAKATAQEARAHNLDRPDLHLLLYMVDFLQHDAAGMEREKPGYEEAMLLIELDTAAYGGEFARARELTHRASDSARRADQEEEAAVVVAESAMHEARVGKMSFAKRDAQAALALANGKLVEGFSAIALGLAGDSAQAERLAGDLGKRFPEDTLVRFRVLPMIHAAVALSGSDAGKAVEALAVAAPYELGVNVGGLEPAYLRGEAYLAAKQGAAARVEFQKILDHPGVVQNDPIGALAHLGLGRAYALAGDSAKAKTAYQDYFALWKNADPNIPILQQAKAEYAKLK